MKLQDEYIWDNYTEEYSGHLKELIEKDGNDFFITQFGINNGKLEFFDNLHPNWKELYNTIFELKPSSIFECGCGGCYHLKNINTILPGISINGADLLQSQIDFGKAFSSLPQSIIENISVLDFTQPLPPNLKFEFVFTHAVIMHLSTDKAKLFLKNMAAITSKYIFLIEGLNNHENWFEMVRMTLPEFDFEISGHYIDNAILLTRKTVV